jgi:hypothetical protein
VPAQLLQSLAAGCDISGAARAYAVRVDADKLWVAPPGTAPPNCKAGGRLYTVDEAGVTPWILLGERFMDSAVCPECRGGEHGNCVGYALQLFTATVVRCLCAHP